MGRVQSNDPDRLVYRSGGGFLMLFGLPFLLAGLFVMCSPLLPGDMQPKDGETDEPISVVFALLFGGVFTAVGAGLVLGRAGKVFDKRSGTVTTWWGMLVPFKKNEYPLDRYDSVTLSKEVRRSKNSTYTVYPVRVEGGGVKTLKIEEPREERKARTTGEEIAKFLGVKLADRTLGAEVVRQANELDESIRQRVERTGDRPEVPDPPADRKTAETVIGDTLSIEIPGRGFQPACVVGLVLTLVVPTFIYFGFVRGILETEMPSGTKSIMVAVVSLLFVALPFILGLFIFLRGYDKGATVDVSPLQLQMRRRGLVGTRTTTIPTSELEELVLVGYAGQSNKNMRRIVARSDQGALEFGQGLPVAELEWLRAVIWNVVSA